MTKKPSAPKGSTRKEMTPEEMEWLKNFDRAFYNNDLKSLERIVPKDKVVNDVISGQIEATNAKNRDIYSKQKAINVQPTATSSWDESFDSFVAGDESIEHHVEDPTLAPKQEVERYTSEDYNPPSFPDEDTLIVAIDHDRAELERKKVRSFHEFIQRTQKGKRYDPAS